MTRIPAQALNFERGIDAITYASDTPTGLLPERHEGLLPDAKAPTPLQTLLTPPTLDDALLGSLRPPLRQREVLGAARFAQALEATLEQLRIQAEAEAGPARTPEAVQALNRALRLLKEESALRDLLHLYRNTLFRG